MSAPDRHKLLYKRAGTSSGDFRKRRRDCFVQIRKEKKDAFLRRARDTEVDEWSESDETILTKEQRHIIVSAQPGPSTSEVLRLLLSELEKDKSNAHRSLESLSILPQLSELCVRNKDVILQLSARIMSFIDDSLPGSSKPQTVNQISALNSVLSALRNKSNTSSTRGLLQLLHSLSVFCGESVAYRNHVLSSDMATTCEQLWLRHSDNLKVSEQLVHFVSQLFENIDQCTPSEDMLLPLYPILIAAMDSPHITVRDAAVRALAIVSETETHASFLLAFGMHSNLVAMFSQISPIAVPCLIRTLANLIEQSSDYTKDFISAGLLSCLVPLMSNRSMSKDICSVLANICAEEGEALQAVLDSGALGEVATILETADFSTRREACYVVCNCAHSTNHDHLRLVLDTNLLQPLCDMLTVMDMQIVEDILSAVECLLEYGSRMAPNYSLLVSDNPVAVQFEECGGRRRLEFLTESGSIDMQIKANELLDVYYSEADELYQSEDVTPPCLVDSDTKNTVDDIIGYVLTSVSSMDQS